MAVGRSDRHLSQDRTRLEEQGQPFAHIERVVQLRECYQYEQKPPSLWTASLSVPKPLMY